MGLAATRVKQRFGFDPRNTNWSNDTSRFGHKQLEKFGWKTGDGLGLVAHATTTHVKVTLKDDTLGLGARLAKKEKGIESDSTGLDDFQRLLGKLNGREDEISKELERKSKDRIINGRWGISFVKGEVLRSTWDKENRTLINGKPIPTESEINDKKRRRDEDKSERKSKKEKKEKKREKKEKKDKSEKKEKKEKKERKEKKEKKEKKVKSDEKEKKEISLKVKESAPSQVISTRLAARQRYIRQKRAAVMDEKALNEIFMVRS
ncbi:unnamed protein product [Kuraishia capsulata CBS 1993]|uniref:Protein PXR1 n=1 Tax=Kuraishia capsulata CBS 1993 TaxID=1382522 RepID=W6MHK3_9ASCO|nr:uncharacterized protein KUCA_T00001441001 [Kuraishia capsulata CBS 1993]CDK25471.1 unnamed protein product [Kuraishia capsulata CBS 1993]